MHQKITFSDFTKAFHDMGYENNFSHSGLRVLFNYLEEYEDSAGESIELDVIALCCDYCESTWEEIAEDYDIDVEGLDETDTQSEVMNYLEMNTVIAGEVPGGCVYLAF
jgi:hypothetical protein